MKLDIQEILSRLDKNDLTVFESLSDEDRGEFAKNVSWMIPQWMSAAHTEVHHRNLIVMFDDICNPGWGAFYHHPELQAKLLALVGSGKTVRHRFFRPSNGKKTSYMGSKLVELIREDHPDIREQEVVLWCMGVDEDQIENMMSLSGMMSDSDRKDVLMTFRRIKEYA